mgnify:FL=1
MEKLEKIIKLLKPKYYNRITYILIISGTSLLTKPLWLELLNWSLDTTNENSEKIQLSIIGQWDWLLGLFVIIIGLYWNTKNRLIDLKTEKISQPEYKNVLKLKYKSFEEVCEVIYPILKDNEYIFLTVGPNSGASYQNELRTDLTMWYKYRSESILPNNSKIKEILNNNTALFDRKIAELVNKMIIHIDAFEEHVQNENFDYTTFQFPQEFKELIEDECFLNAKKSKIFVGRMKWLNKKTPKLNSKEWFLIGSSIFIPEKAKDVDIVIFYNHESKLEIQNKLKSLKMDFKLKFSCNLHTTIFLSKEEIQYKEFLAFNKYKIKGNG